jgi:hypothetical protein
MRFDHKGTQATNTAISNFAQFLSKVPDNQLWNYMGMTVEIDPTVDYSSGNVLVRWLDLEEGVNDRHIYTSAEAFLNDFQPINV